MESSFIILLVRSQVNVVIIAVLLVLIRIHVFPWTLLVALRIIILFSHTVSGLGLWVLTLVIILRRLINILLFVVIHII